MSNQKPRKWINCCFFHTLHTPHNFNSTYAFFTLIWHIFHVTLCSLWRYTYTYINILKHSTITIKVLCHRYFFLYFRSFVLSFFGQFTIFDTHIIQTWNIFVYIYISKQSEMLCDLIRRYHAMECSLWSVFNFNVNIYLTCQTCEINPLKIVAQNTYTHAHTFSVGNRKREKKQTHTERVLSGGKRLVFDIFLCLFFTLSNKYHISFANAFTLCWYEKASHNDSLGQSRRKKRREKVE